MYRYFAIIRVNSQMGIGKCTTSIHLLKVYNSEGLTHVNQNYVLNYKTYIFKTGLRIGKGEGYADMEYAMMVTMGAVNQDTVVITTVHDCQIVDIPDQLRDEYDLMVRISFISPTVEPRLSKPQLSRFLDYLGLLLWSQFFMNINWSIFFLQIICSNSSAK